MSRHFGGPGNFEQQFRRAETDQDLHMQAEIRRGWNQAGLWSLAIVAFAALCYGWHLGFTWPVN